MVLCKLIGTSSFALSRIPTLLVLLSLVFAFDSAPVVDSNSLSAIFVLDSSNNKTVNNSATPTPTFDTVSSKSLSTHSYATGIVLFVLTVFLFCIFFGVFIHYRLIRNLPNELNPAEMGSVQASVSTTTSKRTARTLIRPVVQQQQTTNRTKLSASQSNGTSQFTNSDATFEFSDIKTICTGSSSLSKALDQNLISSLLNSNVIHFQKRLSKSDDSIYESIDNTSEMDSLSSDLNANNINNNSLSSLDNLNDYETQFSSPKTIGKTRSYENFVLVEKSSSINMFLGSKTRRSHLNSAENIVLNVMNINKLQSLGKYYD